MWEVRRLRKNEAIIVQQQIHVGSQIDEHGRRTPGRLETAVGRLEKTKRS